ncbi:MAG: 3-oxoadipate enol-lactonase [Ancalomicrobiaceae bacterium]|nr:3-oxoadipate enol-lactonase [Ancalomicrobiaceae bacterium]
MPCLQRPWGHMHYRTRGSRDGTAVVFVNSLGTDHRMWDAVIDRLPGLYAISFDKRGHGLSATPADGWTIEDLADDVAALIEALQVGKAVVVGCSVGGMVAQAIAVRRPDLLAGIVISNSAAKIGTVESWQARIDTISRDGLKAIVDTVMTVWFPQTYRAGIDWLAWRTMFVNADLAGYIGTCRALAAADFRASTPTIALPVLAIGGSEDKSTLPEVVAGLAHSIPGARLEILHGSGHIPAIDNPDATAGLITDFLAEVVRD